MRSGDREAYAELVRRHQSRVVALCLSLLANSAEAEDAAQEVFVKAFLSIHRYGRDVSFLAWLSRIASNHCLDVLRKRKRHRTDSLDGLLAQQADAGGVSPEPGRLDPDNVENDEKTTLALRALAQLPADYRQVLMLRELNELSYEEIAAAMNCSLEAVRARLRRARLELQEKARHFLDQKAFI